MKEQEVNEFNQKLSNISTHSGFFMTRVRDDLMSKRKFQLKLPSVLQCFAGSFPASPTWCLMRCEFMPFHGRNIQTSHSEVVGPLSLLPQCKFSPNLELNYFVDLEL